MALLQQNGNATGVQVGGVLLLQGESEPGIGLHDIRMKNPDGHWVPIINHDLFSDRHTDVDTSGTLEDGTALVYDTASSQWKAQNIFVQAGYGAVSLATPTALANIVTGATWQTIPVDTAVISTPVNITQDTVNNGITFDKEGIYRFSTAIRLSHDSVAGNVRTYDVRLYNNTDATVEGTTTVVVGRSDEQSYSPISLLVEITASEVGDLYVIQVGNASATIASVTVEGFRIDANSVSEVM